jgi:hypothetical protein
MELRYAIEVENTVIGENAFHIQVRNPALSAVTPENMRTGDPAVYSGEL